MSVLDSGMLGMLLVDISSCVLFVLLLVCVDMLYCVVMNELLILSDVVVYVLVSVDVCVVS